MRFINELIHVNGCSVLNVSDVSWTGDGPEKPCQKQAVGGGGWTCRRRRASRAFCARTTSQGPHSKESSPGGGIRSQWYVGLALRGRPTPGLQRLEPHPGWLRAESRMGSGWGQGSLPQGQQSARTLPRLTRPSSQLPPHISTTQACLLQSPCFVLFQK